MKWIEVRVQFEAPQPLVAEELIADAFHALGLQGVVIEDPTADHRVDWAPDSPSLPAHHAVIGYLADNAQLGSRRADLKAVLDLLAEREPMVLKLSERALDEEVWAEAWKTYFKPLRIGRRIVVKPTWESWAASPDDVIVEIDPGMAFGTGTHPTTALCLQLLEAYLKPGDDVLDIGTGSGILMAAAAKLGAGHLTGVDSDAVAVQTAADNMNLNGIEASRVDLRMGNLVQGLSGPYALVTANIITPVILQLLDLLGDKAPDCASPLLIRGGRLIVSGILTENKDQVAEKMRQVGFSLLETRDQEGWAALVGRLAGG
ncbi:MAG: 50S ribosomal protein L11 methyltransferase [Desulfobacterales bacterium]